MARDRFFTVLRMTGREEEDMWKKLALAATVTGAVFAGMKFVRPRKHRLQHESETEQAYKKAHTRILILGAGFGGLATALKLDQKLKAAHDVSILVVDRNNDMLFEPLLWTVANGRANVDDVVVPIRAFQRGGDFMSCMLKLRASTLNGKRCRHRLARAPMTVW